MSKYVLPLSYHTKYVVCLCYLLEIKITMYLYLTYLPCILEIA
jgi:hypothetical protein